MLNIFHDLLIVVGRIVTIIPLLLIVTIFMGKRVIGQLPIFDFLIIVTVGSVVGADIADPNVNHIPTAMAIILIGLIQRIVASWKLSNRKFARVITFEPTIVVQNGKLHEQNLKKIRYSIDNILQMLRENGVFNISDVETAVVEANGSLSVLKKPNKNSITAEDMNISKTTSSICFPIIIEGFINSEVLRSFHLNETWLKQKLSQHGIDDYSNVFFASINSDLQLHITVKNERNLSVPPIIH